MVEHLSFLELDDEKLDKIYIDEFFPNEFVVALLGVRGVEPWDTDYANNI